MAYHVKISDLALMDAEEYVQFHSASQERAEGQTDNIALVRHDESRAEIIEGPTVGSVAWVRKRLDEMAADLRAGKFPEARDSILSRLGYADYGSYLDSSLWRRIRRRILRRDGSICARCADKAAQVHHLTYTEAVLKGDDDSQLVSVCEPCHRMVEFDESGAWRSDPEKRRVLLDRDGARQEKISTEQARLRYQESENRARVAAGGRCAWCKGNTEHHCSPNDGRRYAIPTPRGEPVDAWLCSACRHALEYNRHGHRQTDEQKLKLLRRKVNVRYTRPKPSTGFSFTKTFRRLNAMQREGIMNEHEWNAELIKHPNLAISDPGRWAELKARYESTRWNGRERRIRAKP